MCTIFTRTHVRSTAPLICRGPGARAELLAKQMTDEIGSSQRSTAYGLTCSFYVVSAFAARVELALQKECKEREHADNEIVGVQCQTLIPLRTT